MLQCAERNECNCAFLSWEERPKRIKTGFAPSNIKNGLQQLTVPSEKSNVQEADNIAGQHKFHQKKKTSP